MKSTQILGWEILVGDDHGRRMRCEADRLEIALGVVFHVGREHRSGDMGARAAREQGITIRVRGRDARAADRASSAANVLDDEGLPHNFPHLLGDDASHDVAWAAGRERHDHRDGSRGITLRARAEWRGKQTKGCDAD